MPQQEPMDAAKAALRRTVRTRRRTRTDAERAAAAQRLAVAAAGLPEVRAAGAAGAMVTAYVSVGTEPGTGPLRAALAVGGCRVLLPVVQPGGVLAWVADPGPTGVWRTGPLGIPQPTGPAVPDALAAVAVVLLPATAAGRDGRRLGQGGGYYDRALAGLPRAAAGGPLRVAVVHDDELLPTGAVPADAYDQPVDVVLTDRRVHRVRP